MNNGYQPRNTEGNYQRNNKMDYEDRKDHTRKMFIGGLSPMTNEDSLRSFYSQWGDVVDAVVMRDPATKRSRGFGFVTYSDVSMVDEAQAAKPHVIDDKIVDSKRALPRPEGGARAEYGSVVKKIFVGGLKDNHDEQVLTEYFSQFGNVMSVKILTDKITGRKRGFAFVEFDDPEAVDKAVAHKNHTIKYILVEVKKSAPKHELPYRSTQQQHGGAMGPGPGAMYQQSAYNPNTAYVYPSHAQAQGAYGGWNGYPQTVATSYQQAPMAPAGGYSTYGVPVPSAPANWNANGYAASSWDQNGYGTSPVAQAPAANGWNGNGGQQNFGEYQQAYNGGPQKAGNLQGNRMNPYSVSGPANYGV